MNIFSRLLSVIPRPSVRLLLGICMLSALMMMGLLVIRSAHDDAAIHRAFNHSNG